MLNISVYSENCNACWKSVLKVSVHVKNCNASSKTSWKFQGMLKTVICVENYVETACWTFQCVLKTVMQVQNYVETACWKFQCVLKTVMHVENYIEISKCVENVYVRHVENHVENCVEIRKNHRHSLRCVLKLSGRGPKIRWQTTRLESEFARVTEVGHIYFLLYWLLQHEK